MKHALLHLGLAMLMIGGGLAATPNLLANPGFETGAPSPWATLNGGGVDTVSGGAFAGTYCGRATGRTASSHGIFQSLLGVAQPGRVHLCSAWVRTSSSTPVTVDMAMRRTDARGAIFEKLKTIEVADQWTKIEGFYKFDVNGTLTVLNFYFNGPPAGVDLLVDEASLSVFDATAPENLLVNADLEDGLSPWLKHGPPSVTASTDSHTGNGALLIQNRTQPWHGAEQSIMGKTEDGRLYYAAGWVITDSPNPETVKLTLQVNDSAGTRFVGIVTGKATSGTWTWLSGHFRMPTTSGLTDVRFFIEGPPAGVNLRADNLYLAPLTGLRRAAVAYPNLRLGSGGLAPTQFALNEKVRSAVSAHFHLASPGNPLKFSNTEPADDIWTYAEANSVIDFGIGRGGSSRGHTFVWHEGLPAWVRNGTFTEAQLQSILWDHIDTKGAYYRHRLPWWDGVNEAMSDSGGVLRGTLWYDAPGIGYAANGDQYIRESFSRARAADPNTVLFYNDYSIEGTNTKSDAVHAMISGMLNDGVPVQGVGFQSHFQATPNGTSVRNNFQRFNDLGIDLHVTELDFRIPVDANGIATPANLATQGDQYFNYCGAVLGYNRLKVLQTWGIYDGASWIPAAYPGFGQALLLDFNLDRKPAYWGMWNALAGQAEKLSVLGVSGGDSTAVVPNTTDQVSANATRHLQANAANDFMTLAFHVPFPGNWNVKLGVLAMPGGGIFQPAFAPPGSGAFTDAGSPCDTYSAGNSATSYDLGTLSFSTAGDWQLRITVTGKNAASSDFDVALDTIRLTPIACSPVVSAIPDQSIAINTAMPSRLVLAEDDTAQGSLSVTATSSNSTLLSDTAIQIEGASPYYTLAATPATDQLGVTTITVTADDGSATGTTTFQLTVTGTALQTWRQQYFDSAAETGPGADTHDADNDGYVNLLEFALGTIPTVSASVPVITLTPVSGALEFVYTRDRNALADVSRTVEWSDTLQPGSWSTAGVTESPLSTSGSHETMQATIPVPPGHPQRFVRLRVNR